MVNIIDVSEENWGRKVLSILLQDKTTKKNIIWATDDYESLGFDYKAFNQIQEYLITGKNKDVIQPRILKTKENQTQRTKSKAEVFTPSWICNVQNNLVDSAWFNRENVFNVEGEKNWEAILEKVEFPKNKTWKNYVDDRRLEITCGEAPYLVSRYDTVTGDYIELENRIGMLDRKLRIVNENAETEEEWLKWSERAYQSTYGFEFQGDSLLIARENLLITYCENMQKKLNRFPTEKELLKIANIISWNLWQMDGLKFTIPFQKIMSQDGQLQFFEEENMEENAYCIIKDWRANKTNKFKDLVEVEEK